VDPGAPERLVGIDVPDPGKATLVEEHGFHRRAAADERFSQPPGGERRGKRLRSDACVEVRRDLTRLEKQPCSEAPDISIDDVRSVV
jgi:hypothetical protein